MTTTTQEPNRKRRWIRLSLLLASILMIWWIGLRLQRARTNRERVAAVEGMVTEIEELSSNDAVGEYEVRRTATWLEHLLNDPGDADDPVRVVKIVSWAPPPETDKQKEHQHNRGVISAAVWRYHLDTGKWPSSDLRELAPPTTYDFFPDGIPTNPVDGNAYTLDETTHSVR